MCSSDKLQKATNMGYLVFSGQHRWSNGAISAVCHAYCIKVEDCCGLSTLNLSNRVGSLRRILCKCLFSLQCPAIIPARRKIVILCSRTGPSPTYIYNIWLPIFSKPNCQLWNTKVGITTCAIYFVSFLVNVHRRMTWNTYTHER